MCVVSNISDYAKDRWRESYPWVEPLYPSSPNTVPKVDWGKILKPEVSKEEFEALKKEVQELKKLLEQAIKFDEATNQPDCEIDEKVDFLKKIGKFVGVDLEEVFKNHK